MSRAHPSRRAVLDGALGLTGIAGVALLAGCSGERTGNVWSTTPPVEAEDRTTRPPDTDLILAARERLHGYRTMLSAARPETGSEERRSRAVGELWATQQDRLEQLIQLSGMTLPALPLDDGAAVTGAVADDAAATTSRGGPGVAVLAVRIRDDLPAVLDELARSTSTNRPMLTSLAGQHTDAAALFGAPVDWPALAGPTGAAAVPVIAATRPAVFGLEVVAARSVGTERARYESVLQPVQSLTRQLITLAGEAAPVPPLGYDLPEPLDVEEQRMALARALIVDVTPAVLSVTDRAGSDREQLESLLRLVAEATGWARALEVPVVPFPGMTLP